MGYSKKKKKKKQSVLRKYSFETYLEVLDFLLYPWKFQKKQGFTPSNSTKLCYSP